MYLIEQDGIETNVPDSNGLTLLHVAAECGYASLLNYLIAFTEIDVNSKDGKADIKPFKLNMPSVLNNRVAAVRILINSFDIELNARNNAGITNRKIHQTPLERAADAGFHDIVDLLISIPEVDVNAEDALGWTPLHSSSSRNRLKVVEKLINHPMIDINKKRILGIRNIKLIYRTPIHDAADRGNVEVLQLLMGHPQIDINLTDDCGISALQWCVEREQLETAKVLLNDPRTDIASANPLGQTALHWAVSKKKPDFVKLLMTHSSIDINQIDTI